MIQPILDKAVSVCESWVNEGFDGAVNRLSRLLSVKKENETK